jgi:hypothetical protein
MHFVVCLAHENKGDSHEIDEEAAHNSLRVVDSFRSFPADRGAGDNAVDNHDYTKSASITDAEHDNYDHIAGCYATIDDGEHNHNDFTGSCSAVLQPNNRHKDGV